MISFIFSKVPPAHSKGNDNYQLKRKHLPANGENFNSLLRLRFDNNIKPLIFSLLNQ
jgi:hypothetical protein